MLGESREKMNIKCMAYSLHAGPFPFLGSSKPEAAKKRGIRKVSTLLWSPGSGFLCTIKTAS